MAVEGWFDRERVISTTEWARGGSLGDEVLFRHPGELVVGDTATPGHAVGVVGDDGMGAGILDNIEATQEAPRMPIIF